MFSMMEICQIQFVIQQVTPSQMLASVHQLVNVSVRLVTICFYGRRLLLELHDCPHQVKR